MLKEKQNGSVTGFLSPKCAHPQRKKTQCPVRIVTANECFQRERERVKTHRFRPSEGPARREL